MTRAGVATPPTFPRPPAGWADHAACSGRWDLFHAPDYEGAAARAKREAKALAICATCPVILECRAEAWTVRDTHAVAGGQTPDDRIRAGMPRLAPKDPTLQPPTPDTRCGSRRGYQAHRARGEWACDDCKRAETKAANDATRRRQNRAARNDAARAARHYPNHGAIGSTRSGI